MKQNTLISPFCLSLWRHGFRRQKQAKPYTYSKLRGENEFRIVTIYPAATSAEDTVICISHVDLPSMYRCADRQYPCENLKRHRLLAGMCLKPLLGALASDTRTRTVSRRHHRAIQWRRSIGVFTSNGAVTVSWPGRNTKLCRMLGAIRKMKQKRHMSKETTFLH